MAKNTVGKRVIYKKRGKELRGTVEDEVSLLEKYPEEDFLDLIQYIRWDDGHHGIRFCYYVREHGSSDKDWIFANRPLSIGLDALEKLFRKALEKRWFRDLLKP
ncbi:MAG: hypothetical protein QXK93_07515 [Candidatus Bathyarchaeia archaeon]